MSLQYKPTKPKKEKSAKAPKAAKEKDFSGKALQYKSTAKKEKTPKPPKPQKERKTREVTFSPTGKQAQFSKVQSSAKGEKFREPMKPAAIAAVFGALVIVAAIVVVILSLGTKTDTTVTAKGLTLVSAPSKTEYMVGESMSYVGFEAVLTMSNGTTWSLSQQDCSFSGYDSSVAGTQTITATYNDMSVTFTVEVVDMTVDETDPTDSNGETIPVDTYGGLASISMKTLPKTKYKVDEGASFEGGVVLLTYADGSTREIELTDRYIYDFSTEFAGTRTIRVVYQEDGVICETTYTITVTE